MREKLALVIAALMMTSMAFAISTTSVSATHATPTISIDPDVVKAGEPHVFELSVTNEGGDLIDTVKIVAMGGLTSIKSMLKMPKDNLVQCANVTLVDGTPVTVVSASVTVPENTELVVAEGESIVTPGGENADLLEDARAKVPDNTDTSLDAGAEVTVKEEPVAIDTDLRLIEETLIDNENTLPEATPVELVAENDVSVSEDLTLAVDNEVDLASNVVELVNAVRVKYTSGSISGAEVTLAAGESITLTGENTVVLPTTTVVNVTSASVTVAENEEVTILGGTTVTVLSPADAVPMPEGWTPSVNKWSGTEDNIEAGGTVKFPFSATALSITTEETYDITVKTTDVHGYSALVVVTLTVDGEVPSIVDTTISPDPAKLTTVTIVVKASEKLSKLGEVTVKQHGVTEEENIFTITMTSTNNITWTGTYPVIENRDGDATVAIKNSTDMVGNVGGENASVATFVVDTDAPDAPKVVETPTADGDVNELPKFTNQPNQWVYGVTTEAKVRICVNAGAITAIPRADDNYSIVITLDEGTNEVGVSLVDEAGNESEENVQEVFLDSLPPEIDMISIAGKGYKDDLPINDTTPTIVVNIDDPDYPDTGSGILYDNVSVELLNENGVHIADLENATPWENTGVWENAYPEELDEGLYIVAVSAKDMINDPTEENFTFVVDISAPPMPDLDAAANPVLNGTTALNPLVQRDATLVFYGSDLEPSSTAKIYLIDQATGNAIKTETTTVDGTGNFSKSLTLAEGKVIRIEVETSDAAGNVSSRVAYGYAMVDATAPSVTLAELPETTDKTSITISGTVSKDAWEEWSDITLTVQVGTGRVVVPIDADGSYDYSLELAEGPNTIVVQATDDVGNPSATAHDVVERTVTPWMTYAIILVIIALLMAVIAIFRK